MDKFQDAKNNEIEIKKAVKNDGDRVVDTCVRDDTLNTTVTVNRELARVSQDLILGAKAGATSDLVDLAKLIRKHSTALTQVTRSRQHIVEDKVLRKLVCSNIFDALMINPDEELNAATPTIHISNSEIARIIEEHQAAILRKIRGNGCSSWDNLVEEEEHITSPLRRLNLSTTYDIELGDDMFDENDEDDILDICFDKVAKDGDLSLRQQRSGSNKSKKKTHERQYSWDSRVAKEFVPRGLHQDIAHEV
ncbi:hypothetical protein RND71_026898 [Anisodus tanguticus]|uniref:Uncharacterized protein n=1 Tax=Anisodus tanguticus TaxID=243964 RepID=A0AAE1RLQ4_9SOLA|nr:hypothetical protein RND71_026898 [Anisodus tanguticus]